MESVLKIETKKGKVFIGAKVSLEVRDELEREAEAQGVSVSDIIRMHLKQKLTFARYGA